MTYIYEEYDYDHYDYAAKQCNACGHRSCFWVHWDNIGDYYYCDGSHCQRCYVMDLFEIWRSMPREELKPMQVEIVIL